MVNLIWHECGILFISHRFSAASASHHVDLNPPSLHTLALSPSYLPSLSLAFPLSVYVMLDMGSLIFRHLQ